MTDISRAAILGGGVIGGGWAARLIENGIDVAIFDPDPEAERKIGAVLANAEHAYSRLTQTRGPKGRITFHKTIAAAVAGAKIIVEAVPERLDLKQKVYAEIEAANPTAIIASSTSGILPTDLQSAMKTPERLIVAHPFNPVYLLPLVEIVGGAKTAPETIAKAVAFYESLGMKPLHIKKEIPAFIADRFLEAVWREGLWLINDGIATTEEIDDAIRFGFGLRWAQMGLFETYRVAGGEAGMRHFIAQFGPCLSWPWTKLMDVPELTDELVEKIASQSDAQSGMHSIRELERIRDDNLVAILHALKAQNWGAGQTLAAHERRQADRVAPKAPDLSGPIETVTRTIPADWTDYNGHMNEARYLDAFCAATDAFMALIGADAEYIKGGQSYFTAETHIRHLNEANAGDPVRITTQVLAGAGKKLHLFHRLWRAEDLLATGEHMLIHVDLKTRRASEPSAEAAAKCMEITELHSKLSMPEGAGRSVGQAR